MFVASLALLAVWSSPAQALSWKPLGAVVVGKSSDTKLQYGPGPVQTITCESEFKATVTLVKSPTMTMTSWVFRNCVNAEFTASASISNINGPMTMAATLAGAGGDGEAQFEFPKGSTLTYTLYTFFFNYCIYELNGPQSLSGAKFTNATDTLSISTNSATFKWTGGKGSAEQCGPASEKAKFSGTWDITPVNLEIEK
ncbi:MAG TPA: hypothetical protein VHP56_03055 [Solirubrobacterales bacterium]|nr:hypothetical protein [Solirubrobacterales bacterium]